MFFENKMTLVKWLDRLFVTYFITHVPTTVLLDTQLLFRPDWLSSGLAQWFRDNAVVFEDSFLTHPPLWLRAFVLCEVLFQLPLFFVITYGIIKRTFPSYFRF
jgi:hypothetical protein